MFCIKIFFHFVDSNQGLKYSLKKREQQNKVASFWKWQVTHWPQIIGGGDGGDTIEKKIHHRFFEGYNSHSIYVHLSCQAPPPFWNISNTPIIKPPPLAKIFLQPLSLNHIALTSLSSYWTWNWKNYSSF